MQLDLIFAPDSRSLNLAYNSDAEANFLKAVKR